MAMDAIGRTSADESRELAEHLEHCEECRGDAADVRSAAEALTLLDLDQVDGLGREADRPVPSVPSGLSRLSVPSSLGAERPWSDGTVAGPTPVLPDGVARTGPGRTRRRRMVGAGVVVGAVAAAVVAVVLLGGAQTPPTRTVALTGQRGVVASVSLTSQSWGTRATLRESGQAGGQVFTVAMKSASGRWWVAGSYRTTGRSGAVEVPLSCAVQVGQITTVWVSDQAGHRVLSGYVS
jgi:hypothetical protein